MFYRGNDAIIYHCKELRWGYWNHRVHLPVPLLINVEKVKGKGHRTLITEKDFRTITAFHLHLSSWKIVHKCDMSHRWPLLISGSKDQRSSSQYYFIFVTPDLHKGNIYCLWIHVCINSLDRALSLQWSAIKSTHIIMTLKPALVEHSCTLNRTETTFKFSSL